MPKFSIIIPCFNNERTVSEAIHSALAQKYDDFQVCVTDNGSSDGSAEIIDSIRDDRVRKNICADVVSKSDNWNRAYAFGRDCEYFVTLHADDRLTVDALRDLSNACATKPALVHGRFRTITQAGDYLPQRRFPFSYSCLGEEFRELLLLTNIVAVPGATIRADLFEPSTMWSADWTYLQDVDLWWRCGELGHVVYTTGWLGDFRGGPALPSAPRHSAEHLTWLMCVVDDPSISPRLRRAAVEGLRRHLCIVDGAIAAYPATAGTELSLAAEKARVLLASEPPQVGSPMSRLRRLRLFYALRTAIGLGRHQG